MTPFEVLGLPESAAAADVKSRWVELAKAHHPDVGGLAEDFRRYHAAYVAALALSSTPKVCGHCQGKKVLIKHRGWFSIEVVCPTCLGSGLDS